MPGRIRPRRATEVSAGCCARLAIVAALALVTAGCGSRALAPHIRYQTQTAQKTYGDCTRPNSDQCTRIRLRWPVVAVAPTAAVADSVNAFVRSRLFMPYDGGKPLPNEDSVTAGFIDAYRTFLSSAPGAPASGWSFSRRIEPLGDTLGVVSLAVTEEGFLGGAHPNSTTSFANFDAVSGRALRLSDLILDSGREQLNGIGERAFRRVRKIAPGIDLNAAGFWFDRGDFKLNENFAVTRSGMLFFFNAYEVAPYSYGATSISLPWSKVMPLIRTDGPLAGHRGR